MSTRRRPPTPIVNLLLLLLSPFVFLVFSETVIGLTGIDTDIARNDSTRIDLPVWLLANETWVADRRSHMQRSGEEAIEATDVAWLHHFEEARWIQYRMKPRVDVQAINPFNEIEVDREVTFRLASNSDGFREREFPPRRPGIVRIVTLGDSSTFGWGAEPEHTYQRLLEEHLEAWQPGRFEVLNLGIPGHNTRHGVGMLEHYAAPLEPDIVIIGYGANDPRRVPTPTDELLAIDDTWLGAVRFAALELRTYRLLRRMRFQLADPLTPSPDAGSVRLTEAVPIDDFRANLYRLIGQVRDLGAEPLLMSVCTPNRLYVATTRDVASAEGSGFVDVAYLFDNAIEPLRSGELYPDRVARYRELYGREALAATRSLYVASDGCHPHWVGHSLIADRMFELVRQALGQPVVPGPSPGDPQ